MSDFDMLQLTRNGLPKRLLLSLAKRISLTIQEFADIMHISERTLQRYDDDAIIKTEYAEKAVELARLYTCGEEVFGSLDKFKTWMKTPLHVFRGETPVSLLASSVGFDMVFKELGRIEHGVFASALVPEEFNYLINPLHPKAGKVKIIKKSPFSFNGRLVGQ